MYSRWHGDKWINEVVEKGNIYLSFIRVNNKNIPNIFYSGISSGWKVAKKAGNAWEYLTIDSEVGGGPWDSNFGISFDAQGNMGLVYQRLNNSWELRFAYWTGNNWSLSTIDHAEPQSTIGDYSNGTAYDPSGNPQVLYAKYYYNGEFFFPKLLQEQQSIIQRGPGPGGVRRHC